MVGRLKYLVDTNVWLELLLEQEQAASVRNFFQAVEGNNLALTEFSLYSIAIVLTKLKKDNIFREFILDTIEDSGVTKVRLENEDLLHLIEIRQNTNLDFDDAYQYTAAEKHNLTLVSFDSDFDVTVRGKMTPAEVEG